MSTTKLEPFEVYKLYLALKFHFSDTSYDFHVYNGETRGGNVASFEKRRDKSHFYRLSYKYRKNEMTDFMVANFKDDQVKWVGDLLTTQSHNRYIEFKKRKESNREFFRDDLQALFDQVEEPIDALQVLHGQNPLILKEIYAGNTPLETLIIVNEIMPIEYFSVLDKNLGSDILWPELKKKAMRLRGFMKFSKPAMRKILLEFVPWK